MGKIKFYVLCCYIGETETIFLTFQAPDEVDRQSMLEALFWKVMSASDIDLERIAKKTAVSMNDILLNSNVVNTVTVVNMLIYYRTVKVF